MDVNCFRCGSPDHLVANCPVQAPRRTKLPPAPSPPGGAEIYRPPPPPPLPADPEVARRGANAIKAAMGWGDGSPVVDSAFRRAAGLLPKTEGQLREIALSQVAESRAGRAAL